MFIGSGGDSRISTKTPAFVQTEEKGAPFLDVRSDMTAIAGAPVVVRH